MKLQKKGMIALWCCISSFQTGLSMLAPFSHRIKTSQAFRTTCARRTFMKKIIHDFQAMTGTSSDAARIREKLQHERDSVKAEIANETIARAKAQTASLYCFAMIPIIYINVASPDANLTQVAFVTAAGSYNVLKACCAHHSLKKLQQHKESIQQQLEQLDQDRT